MIIQKNSKKDNIIKYNRNTNIFGGGPITNQKLYRIIKHNGMFAWDTCNTRCKFCNFNLCTPSPQNHNNNVNGLVVALFINLDEQMFFHYTCIYNYITSHSAVRIQEFPINIHDTKRLITDSLDNNNFEGTDFFSPDFKMLQREIDVPVNIRNTPCRLCSFPLCLRIINTTNNINGYVIHLHNLNLFNVSNHNSYYYHYKCICKYFTNIRLLNKPFKSPYCETIMDRVDISKLLNINGKADAVNGNGFY
jgi:hypothetical protein